MGGFADLDNDMDLDLVFAGDGAVYINDGGGSFSTGPSIPNASTLIDPRAVAFADIENDGDLDFIYVGKKVPNKLYRNDYSGSNNWIKIELIAPNGQAGAFGSKVTLYSGDTMIGMREAKSNYGYLAQDDPVLHFGLGQHSAVRVEIKYLDGTITIEDNVQANQTHRVSGNTVAIKKLNIPGPFNGSITPNFFNNYFRIELASTRWKGVNVGQEIFDLKGRLGLNRNQYTIIRRLGK